MKSICFFCSYFHNNIPYYTKSYLSELSRHFGEIVLLTNEKEMNEADLEFLAKNKIDLMYVKNEGFDFGMWYKAFMKYPVEQFERVGLVNDSCILFKTLDEVFETINKSDWDYCGLIDSTQLRYHIQSFFIVINKKAIPFVKKYFQQHGILSNFEEVIQKYEIGITQSLLNNNLKVGSVFNRKVCRNELNPSFSGIENLIRSGFPMIKKKIIFGNYRKEEPRYLTSINFDFNAHSYITLIKKFNKNPIIDFYLLQNDSSYFIPDLKFYTRVYMSKYAHLIKHILRKSLRLIAKF